MDYKETSTGLFAPAVVVAAISCILLTPPAYSFYKLGTEAIFTFFRQDAFYYLAVAVDSRFGFYSFDGQLPTNGFHPLWQFYVTALLGFMEAGDKVFQISLVFWLSVCITTCGYLLCGLGAYLITESKLLAISVVPGFFYLAFSFVFRFFGSPWSFMNGMESCLSVLFGGMLLLLPSVHYQKPEGYFKNWEFHFVLGIIISLAIMARLDDIFILLSFGLVILLLGPGNRIVSLLSFGFPPVIVLTVYCIWNYLTVGLIVPVSGLSKGGFAFISNVQNFVNLVFVRSFPADCSSFEAYVHALFLWVQMLFPMLVAVWFILVIVGDGDSEERQKNRFWMGLLGYICLKALYNMLNVEMKYQGLAWYYCLSILSINFVAIILVSKLFKNKSIAWRPAAISGGALFACFLVLHVMMATTWVMKRGNLIYDLFLDRNRITEALLTKDPGIKLVELDDGFFRYSLDIPAIHGLGLVIDKEGYLSIKKHRFLDYCYKRGFNVIASLQYSPELSPKASSSEIEKSYRHSALAHENLADYEYELLLSHPKSGASFVRFKPKAAIQN